MRIFRKAVMALALVSSMLTHGAFAQDASDLGEPAITIKTNAYASFGEANKFSILIGVTEKSEYYDIDMGFGPEEFEATYATIDSVGAWHGSTLLGRVSEKGEIKIYGDASKIDVIHAIGCYITDIDLSKCENLDILVLEHNELKGLDLTPNTKLSAIYLSDNPGSEETPIIIGTPKPNLQILEADIIGWLDPDFRPDYPKLKVLDLYYTRRLKKIDLSGCPQLVNLVLELTDVETLDLTPVPNLWHLNIGESRIREVDFSKVPKLGELFCSHTSGTVNTDIKIESLDLTQVPELTYLSAASNNLTSLDISKNPKLRTLYIRRNNLTALDISANPDLASIDIDQNRFTYSTLPADRTTFREYFYSQKPYKVSRVIGVDSPIDFTCMLRPESNTYARVMLAPIGAEPSEVDVDTYTWENGMLTFNTTFTDSVYVEFANSELAEYSLTTSRFMVKTADEVGKPSRIVSMMVPRNSSVNFKVGVSGATAEAPRKLLVDFGDGSLKEFDVTSEEAATTVSGTSTNYNMYIYMPEEEVLSALDFDGQRLLSLDLKAATELRYLSARGCQLSTVNLAYNRCLASIDLSDNTLSTLDLAGVSGNYEKTFLTKIVAANNRIANFNILNTSGCRYLDLSNNKLEKYDLKNYDNMLHLDLSGNKIQTVNMAYLSNAEYINLSNNHISEIENVIDMPQLVEFNLSGNMLSLATLPFIANVSTKYIYAPQSKIVIAAKAPSVALDDQYVDINGNITQYKWVKTDGTVLVEGTDYTIKDGFSRFLTIDGDAVHCEITNGAFPAFTGENVLCTTDVIPMGAPTTVVASFTVSEISDNPIVGFRTKEVSNVYIDWTSEGVDFQSYPARADVFIPSSDVHAVVGKKAVVYTYDTPSDITVFSISGIGMSDFDGSSLTDITMLGLYNTGLEQENLIFPTKTHINGLNITEAHIHDIDLSEFPALESLVLTGNDLESIDLSKAPLLKTASIANNNISSVKLGNPEMWGLDLTRNNLSTLDVSGTPVLQQLLLSSNQFSEIDLSPVASTLRAMILVGNRFTFATLPRKVDFPLMLDAYYYANQAPVDAEVVDGKVDLADQARVGDTETVYTWYYGEISVDADTGEIIGEMLSPEGDDPEYSIENGVTTFYVNYSEPVICVMTNAEFPNLVLYTDYLDISATSAIGGIIADNPDESVNVYNLQGMLLRENVRRADAVSGLAPGIYMVGGRKVMVRR
ncbi:hypothetical protein [Muribaculum sp.]|uniref:leucine-rich repeat domain-containing protein n=1 Tax=Muribaculum sp. TaxID=1918611 RepID=UPI0023C40823|nr:hypothetical protein [Muribaculum sp.]MDE5706046.1 hypothetical protein [Muribaculum sp.]